MNRRQRGSARAITLLALLVVAAVAALIHQDYRWDLQQASQRVSGGSRIAQTPCGPIEYAVHGDGPPVLVVHGAGGGYDQALDLIEPIVARGFRAVVVSRFGYLRTPLPADASAAAQADAHACLLDALDIPRAAVLGFSAGAPSSLQFALRHRDRCSALILLVPATYVPRPADAPSLTTPPATQFLFDTVLKSDFLFWAAIRYARTSVLRSLLATPPTVVENASAAERARVDRIMRQILPVSPRRQGLVNDAAIISSLERYELERISAPALVISVADDLFGTYDAARYTAQHLPRGRFVGYTTGGHVWVGHQEQVMAEIEAFLRQR
jgi:2-hydroxy-6-oxonona-2,4-dienedioate hydrolase